MFRTILPGQISTGVKNQHERLMRQWQAYRADEAGSLLVLGLFCFVIMLLLSGFALDAMRAEERRTVLMNTADRASLAAADLRQALAPKDVVKDYFRKAGLKAPNDADIVVQQGNFNEWRSVAVTSQEAVPTWFMRMVGFNSLPANAASTAEERVGQVEISLVLDVSGSMNSNNRLVNLKPAAKDFIDTMFDTVEAGKLSMSIVTYSTQVSLGPDLLGYFGNTAEHNLSSCLEFNNSDFNTPAMQPKTTAYGSAPAGGDRLYQLNGVFDPFYSTNNIETAGLWNCPPDVSVAQNPGNNRTLMAYSGSRTALKAKIDALAAGGNTSIDLGMKWGAGLLDPSMAPVVQSLIARGKAPSTFGERPYAYTNKDALKVIVLMTDGENTTAYGLNSAYDQGPSRLYRNTTNNSLSGVQRYSLYDSTRSGSSKYYSFYTGTWRTTPWGTNASDYTADNTDTVAQMTWQEVWKAMSLGYFADNIIKPLYGSSESNRWRASSSNAYEVNSTSASTMDTRTLNMCSAAKSNNVKIFTIGFEASTAGQNLLRSCATTPAHFYSVAGLNIKTAFSAIASSISKLRLTH
jgi:hypothetical protein